MSADATFCSQCGFRMPSGARFCAQCGAALVIPEPPLSSYPPPSYPPPQAAAAPPPQAAAPPPQAAAPPPASYPPPSYPPPQAAMPAPPDTAAAQTAAGRAQVRGLFVSGLVLIAIGVAISWVAYAAADALEGGTYIVAYGPIVIGAWRILRAVYYSTNPAALARRISKRT